MLTSVRCTKPLSCATLYRLELWGVPYVLNPPYSLITFKLFQLYFRDFLVKKKNAVSNTVSCMYNMFLYVTPKKQENYNSFILHSYVLSWKLKNNRICLSVFLVKLCESLLCKTANIIQLNNSIKLPGTEKLLISSG